MSELVYFGGGCFWCTEAIFSRLQGVSHVRSGYMGGNLPDPTYERVCSGVSGYIEVIEVSYDPKVIDPEILLSVFFATHDPTTYDRQGNDSGSQYRSVIFGDTDFLDRAKKYKTQLEQDGTFQKIVTEFRETEKFYPAEMYHQNYYENNVDKPYCAYIISPKIAKLREKFSKYLKK